MIDELNQMLHDIAWHMPLTVKCGYVYRLDEDRGFLFQNGTQYIFIQPVSGEKNWEAKVRPACVPACAAIIYEHIGGWCEGMIENGVRIWAFDLFPDGS